MRRSLTAFTFIALTSIVGFSSQSHAQNEVYDDADSAPQTAPRQNGPANGQQIQPTQSQQPRKRVRYVREDLATSDDTVNIRFYPINLLVGLISVDADFRLGDFWTLGPSLGFWNASVSNSSGSFSDFSVKMFRVGARANWHKNGVFTDGLYIGPSIDYSTIDVSSRDSNGATASAKGSILSATALIGYGWFWDSFNMLLGVGGTVGLGPSKIEVKSSSGSTTSYDSIRGGGLALEFAMGFKF